MSEWNTDDMSLAAFLVLEDQKCIEMKWDMGSCYFVFEECDDLLDLVQDFVSDEATVSPRRYNMTFAALKKEMFNNRPTDRSRRRTTQTT